MRVLHVIPGLSPFYGGPTTAILDMCRELNRQGVAAEIATTDAGMKRAVTLPVEPCENVNGTRVYRFRSPFLQKYGFSWTLVRWLQQQIDKVDLLHIHSFFSCLTRPAAVCAARHQVPYIIRPLGQLNPWSLRKNGFTKTAYLYFIGKKCLDNAAALHCTSEDEMRAAQRLSLQAPVVVLPLGVSVNRTVMMPSGTFRERYPFLRQKKLVVFLSRLDPKKGLDLLIPAVQSLSARRDDFVLVIAGSGEQRYEQHIHALVRASNIGDKVVFTGFIQGSAKTALLRDADIFVLPSYDENFGLAVAEAMAAGLPVVVSEHVGIHHQITRWGAGMVTACHSDEIASALNGLLDDELLRRSVGENGRRLVEEQFSWDVSVKELIKVYTSILASERQLARSCLTC